MIRLKHIAALGLLSATAAIGAQVVSGPAPVPAPTEDAAPAVAVPDAKGQPLQPGQAIPRAELEAFIDAHVRSGMADKNVAGVTVSVVQNDQNVLLKGYGIAGTAPFRAVDPSRTMFRIGSVSKTMTWIALMREVEKGRLRLEDPVNQHLPPELHIPDQGFERPIRVVDLMAHAGGMEDRALGHLFFNKPEQILPPAEYLARYRPDRVREAGTLSTYSNYGSAVAGHIVARLNGQDFQTVAERDIFAPLGMTRTSFREPYPARDGIARPIDPALGREISTGFRWSGGQFRPMAFDHVASVAAAGSVSATAEDMARYMRMLLRDGKFEGATIFGPKSAALFRTPIMKVPDGVNGWAHGFSTQQMPGGFRAFGHGGGTSSFFTQMTVIPELDLGVFISTNTVGGGAISGPLTAAIVDRFYARTQPVQRAGSPALVQRAGDYEGNYVATRRAFSGLEKFVGMMGAVNKVSVTPEGYLVTAGSGGAQSWAPTDKPGQFRSTNGEQLLNFALDDNGRATMMYHASGANAFERAGPLVGTNLLIGSAVLAFLAAFGLWVAFAARRAAAPDGTWRRRSYQALLAGGALWIVGIVSVSTWLPGLGGGGRSMFDWPATPLVLGSTAALLATIATLASAAMLVAGLRQPAGAGRVPVMPVVRQGLVILVFLWLALLVALRGGLLPWS